MNPRHLIRRALAVMVAVALLAPSAATLAWAIPAPSVPVLPALSVNVAGVGAYSFSPTGTVSVDASGTFSVDDAAVRNWVNATLAPPSWAVPVESTRSVSKKHRLVITKSRYGRHLDVEAAIAAIKAEILAECANPPATSQTIVLNPVPDAPRMTENSWGRTIVVVIPERRLYLYNNAKLEKKFRVAVGQRRYPTPTGKWKVVGKVKNPSWHNPHSSWSRSMPDYIAPGPRNPLGTRALYLSAPGIRIHGTNNIRSIGTPASHGCIRMLRRDVEWLYPKIKIGTVVYIVK